MFLSCAHCKTPCAELTNGVLIVKSRHHGAEHLNVLPLADLWRKWQAQDPEGAAAWLKWMADTVGIYDVTERIS